MTKSAKQVQQELDAYLSGKTDKDLKLSDNRIIAAQVRGQRLKESGKMKEAAVRRVKTTQWQENQKIGVLKRKNNAQWRTNREKAMRELAQDPVWQESQKIGAEKRKNNPNFINSMLLGAAKRESNQDYQKKRAEKNRKQAQDPFYLDRLKQGVKLRNQDPEYHKALLEGAEKKLLKKGLIKTPAGLHLRQTESAQANGISVGTLQKRIKTDPTNYYYVKQENCE